MESEQITYFDAESNFCSECGSILPLLREFGGVVCYICKREWGPESFGSMALGITINFNNKYTYEKPKAEDKSSGPQIERKCPQCGNDKMSYVTLQLRSADEGQTVFYTCLKCKFKETENS
ncbi:RNA polymerase I subunit RpI12 [Cotesia typhae]|uniref:RNA polymerase I subunit RpI12 n=1 Tax=Cotesia typhae TaxID=2053667 RepID=UPI003D684E75